MGVEDKLLKWLIWDECDCSICEDKRHLLSIEEVKANLKKLENAGLRYPDMYSVYGDIYRTLDILKDKILSNYSVDT